MAHYQRRAAEQAAPPAVDRVAIRNLIGTLYTPDDITSRIDAALTGEFNMVAPALTCGELPEGWGVTFTVVFVQPYETYAVSGKGGDLGLDKGALGNIARAAGVSWDSRESMRTDDGGDPHYCSFVAVAEYKDFDGTPVRISGNKEVDYRDSAAEIQDIWREYHDALDAFERRARQDRPKDPTTRIRDMRKHILGLCETKAKGRAIRSLGVRTSYSREQIFRPFVVARAAFTGQTADPELRRAFAIMKATRATAGMAALFGPEAPMLPAKRLTGAPRTIDMPVEAAVPAPSFPSKPAPPGSVCEYCGATEEIDLVEGRTGPVYSCRGEKCVPQACADAARAPEPRPRHAAPPAAPSAPQARPQNAPPAVPPPPGASGVNPPPRHQSPPGRGGGERLHNPRGDADRNPSGFTIPSGRMKGQPIEEATDDDLKFWVGVVRKNLNDPSKAQYAAKDRLFLAGLEAEIAYRDNIPF